MTEIHFPFTWYNITDKNNSFTYSEGGNQQSYVRIAPGFYRSVAEIVQAING